MKKIFILTLTLVMTLTLSAFSTPNLEVGATANSGFLPTGKNYIEKENIQTMNLNSISTIDGIKIKSNTTYTISILADFTQNNAPNFLIETDFYLDETMQLSGDYFYYTFTTSNSDILSFELGVQDIGMAWDYYNGGFDTEIQMQLEEGSTRTTYEQYDYPITDTTPPLINGATAVRLINVDSTELISVLKNDLTSTDETDGDITIGITISRDTYTANSGTIGEYEVDFSSTDSSGNTTTITVTYKVIDVADPVISLVDSININLEYGGSWVEPGYSATDNYDGSVTVTTSGTVNDSILGTYTLYYNATDTSGNTASQKTRVVNVVDTTSPVQTLTGSSTIYVEIGENYTEQGATYIDTYDGSGSSIISGDTVNVAVPGTYTVRYNITDTNGNIATEITRTVVVQDTTSPNIVGADSVTYNTGDLIKLDTIVALYTANDIHDGNMTASIVIDQDNFNNSGDIVGTYSIVLKVTDTSGNVATKTVTINIYDNKAPVFTTTLKLLTHEYVDNMTQQDFKDYFGVS